ncbi:MAG: hypothetical protein AMQ22_00018 [Candidatus Methanofastidiosum methylothiophilum]|uniref:AP2/ERF domain-containing protein n=1 Tax=Candidatus Methanofastidiosum methylothiophilum TaxID=1705564 RepID=A0A150J9A9_9EURY|nr:MAG: hypothetical protein AMQ22_00018 [Candidatus Methanofastidiosum methylthiophilus]
MSKVLVMENGVPKIVESELVPELDEPELLDPVSSKQEILEIRKKYRKNPKEYRGVSKAPSGKFQARFRWNKLDFYLGSYVTKDDAKRSIAAGKKVIQKLKENNLLIEVNSK